MAQLRVPSASNAEDATQERGVPETLQMERFWHG